MKSMGLENVRYFDPKKLLKVAQFHATFMYKRVTGGMDADGKRFPNYTKDYAEKKAAGFGTGSKGGRKGGPKGQGLSRQVSPPDFRLRGLTMFNLRDGGNKGARKVGKDFYEIGWDGEHAAIVEGQASKGRDIISGIPDREMQFIAEQLGIVVDKEWRTKIKSQTITVGR